MMNPHCKIGKIRMKAGGAEIRIFEPPVKDKIRTIEVNGGKVTIEQYDYHLLNADAVYILESAKHAIMYG